MQNNYQYKKNENNETDLSQYVFGKVQPQSMPLEEVVLGALMLDKDALSIVVDILTPESFYKDTHGKIYESILELYKKNQPIDLLTVTERLKKDDKLTKSLSPFYLVGLTERVASAANIEYHSRIIAQKAMQRELIKVCGNTMRLAYEDTEDTIELIDTHEQSIFELARNNLKGVVSPLSKLIPKSIKNLEAAMEKGDGITGVPSGFTEIDLLTAGWQSGDLIIVAARPGMGKTAFVLSMAAHNAMLLNIPIAIFSLEMSKTQLTTRLISMEAEISGTKIRSGRLDENEFKKYYETAQRMSEAPIYIDDTPGIGIMELRAKSRRMKMQYGIKMVIVDYLQLMGGANDGKRQNREQEISAISRSLKILAKELNIPVIALSQLSRACETRGGDKRPHLSDLRESGAIEQDSDVVSFLYRPEYYKIEEDEYGNSLKGVTEVITAKHRNGELKTVKIKFQDSYAKFTDIENPFSSNGTSANGTITRDMAKKNGSEYIPF